MKKLVATLIAAAFVLSISTTTIEAGRIPGPGIMNSKVPAFGTVTTYATFRGGQMGRAYLVGDGDTDVDIYVYDQNGNRVASGTGFSDRESVSWYVSRTQQYRIVLRNRGRVYNRVLLTTN